MTRKNILVAAAGVVLLVIGSKLFLVGSYSSNWVSWIVGPLLWFTGCAMVLCGGAIPFYTASTNETHNDSAAGAALPSTHGAQAASGGSEKQSERMKRAA
jgi:hypothetical protein